MVSRVTDDYRSLVAAGCAAVTEPAFWGRLSGSLSLKDMLAGKNAAGYDFFGLMLTGPQGMPSGTWGMTQFSLGPTLERRHAPVPGETMFES